MNWGLGAIQVKRMVVELTASACTLPGAMVGTVGGRGEEWCQITFIVTLS